MVKIGGDIGGIDLEPGDTITVNGNEWTYKSDGTLEGPALSVEQGHIGGRPVYVHIENDTIYADTPDNGTLESGDATVGEDVRNVIQTALHSDYAEVYLGDGSS